MKLEVLGSGTGIIRKERSSPAFLLEMDGIKMLFDCGWKAASYLADIEYPLHDLDHIFLSHPHADHSVGLPTILQSIHISNSYPSYPKRDKLLTLHGFSEIEEFIASIKKFQYPEQPNYPFKVETYHDGDQKEFNGLKVKTRVVPHVEYFTNVAFRVEKDQESFVYSGDCGYNQSLIELAQGADILLCEMCIPSSQAGRPNHLSPLECGQIAAQAGVRTLVVFHLYDNIPEAEARAEIGKHFSGKVVIPQDLEQVSS